MRAFVTGATGLIGNAIAARLHARGDEVVALVRDPARAERVVQGARLVRGDVTETVGLADAMRGCDIAFHAAGMPEQWQPDDTIFDRVNRGGTRNVLEAAREAGVKRVVYTSTMDVFAAPPGGVLVEDRVDPEPKHTAYERSKQAAELEAERVRARGLEVVFVNPSAVYGPSPVHVGLNSFFIKLLKREAPLVPPGGMSIVYVDGCADAHLAAAERGRDGERYLVSDAYVTMRELAEVTLREAGDARRSVPTAPVWIARAVAAVGDPLARRLGRSPLLAKGVLEFLLWQAHVDASKAKRELGFVPRDVADGVRGTIEFLRREGLVR